MSGRRRPQFVAFTLAVVLAAGLGGLELGLRIAFPHGVEETPRNKAWPWVRYDGVLGFENEPNYRRAELEINELGLRGPATSEEKAEGTRRLICVGDSRTFGIQLDLGSFRYDADYPAFLRQRLDRNPGLERIEVINAGVIGASSSYGLRQLLTRLHALSPDVVVVGFGFNDLFLAWDPALRVQEPEHPFAGRLLHLALRSHVVQLGFSAYRRVKWLHPEPLSVRWVSPAQYEWNLRRFAELSRAQDYRLLFLTQALRPIETGEDLPAFPASKTTQSYELYGVKDLAGLHRVYESYQQIVRRVAQEEGIPIADAEKAFREHKGPPLFGRYDKAHPNREGAAVIARTVHETLLQQNWIEADPQP